VKVKKTVENKPSAPAWMSAFGGLRHLHKETKRINRILEQEFERIEEDEPLISHQSSAKLPSATPGPGTS
jgi:hypothetical protein